ncbi:MAG: DNA cytosine methyltransferase [Anaerosacchariphilus sp.]
MPLKLGSLFDGIGVFPLAAMKCGITPAWASEIEKAPVSITRRHFPEMEHLGDIMKLNGAELEPVDILTFGSPCQNLSTAGDREGLAGKKSGLFYEAIRIIREMRDATNGIYPAFAVWENVMGAFSSGDRMDFRAVLEAFAGCPVPMPPSEHWASAGMVRGGESDISWRLLDAQYWGSPGSSSEENGYSLWRILEESVAPRYYLSAAQCSRILRYAASLGRRPPEKVEYFLKKQGGTYPSSFRYRSGKCAERSKKKTKPSSSSALDGQMSLFPHFLPAAQTASASGMKEKTGEKREVSDT